MSETNISTETVRMYREREEIKRLRAENEALKEAASRVSEYNGRLEYHINEALPQIGERGYGAGGDKMKRFTPIPISNEFDMPAIRIIEDKEGRYVRHKDAIAEIEALRYLSEQQAQIVNKLTASLNRIRGENEALRAKHRWIPVTERLPDATESRYVLVACRGGLVRETLFVPDSGFFKRRFTHTFSPDAVSDLFECGAEFGYVVTHWMPLPAAPEQESPT